ncbi:MAG: dTDP-4-dehydrorhamnose reductase [Ethanoligenens sp.]|uniref:dTDP-4-dehydrorhamnose reductase n=1 Tax=Ethanoligenens sp. TaxID=2099655 RepID=UPI0039E7654E
MRMLIIAADGQLGTDAVSYFSKKYEVSAFQTADMDVTDPIRVNGAILAVKPDVVLNCAAMTNVDGCEAKAEQAYRVNAYGAGLVALAASRVGAYLVHISTDYVFAGDGKFPYVETDRPSPKNVYGASKLSGEQHVQALCPNHAILRTAWLYGPHGNNFVKTMLKLAKEHDEISVVTDQVGNPTSTFELVRIIDAVVTSRATGIFHATCEGVCSWNAFAREIFRQAGVNVRVKDVTSEEFVRPAHRPSYSVLSKDKLAAMTGHRPADWQDALREYFDYEAGNVDF